jgi:DNA polymerase III subunit alpha
MFFELKLSGVKMPFVHLHLHTIYSFLDGLVKPSELMNKAKSMDMKAVAITDHGNMHGAVDFYLQAMGKAKSLDEAPVKPILGMEAYISAGDRTVKTKQDAYHIILLASNATGYRNLCYISSKSYIDGFYYKPRIDRTLLKDHAEGIIAFSACLGGEIPKALMSGRYEDAVKIAREYQDIFGKENFFIEIQVNGLKEQTEVNPFLIKLAKEVGAGLVATNDVHYLSSEHAEAQDILFCINEKKKVQDTDRMHHDSNEFYFKSEEDMRELFAIYGEDGQKAIENTWEIAQRCNVELTLDKHFLPEFETFGKSESDYLKEISEEGLAARFEQLGTPEERKGEYTERLNYELEMINTMGFPGYFLIVSDFIKWAKKNDIPVGPGRGSGAGSLVAFATEITDIDPIRFGLVFERFLNPERVSMPDFDVDFCQDKREKVLEYVNNKYGEKNVAQIAVFGQLKAKSAVRDVARALDISLATADRLAKIVPDDLSSLYSPQYSKKFKDFTGNIIETYGVSKETADDPDLLRAALQRIPMKDTERETAKALVSEIDAFSSERELIRKDDDFSRIIKIARQIEGLLRQPGKHACGVVIGHRPIFEHAPLFVDKDSSRVTQYDKDMVEKVGLVKFDFLGLKTLTMISQAIKFIKEKDPSFDIDKIPLDDAATYRFLCSKSTKGIFQMESGGFEKMIHQMKPDRFEDLIAAVALYRPGPMDIIPNYIRRKHGKEDINYDHKWLEDILKETFGLIVYQEQVMQISRKMAGFSMGKADILRRAMGKKKAKDMEEMKIGFIAGAQEQGINKDTAVKVFDHMEKFASYGFNKSHAACYADIAYQTAYLKTHYPVEFLSALISSDSDKSDKVFSYISDARSMGINVYPPDINKSHYSFSIEEKSIRFGMGAIKNVGEAAIEEVIKERETNGPFKSLIDFTSRINMSKVNSRTIEFLIKSGAFDFTGINRGILFSILPTAIKEGENIRADKESGQMNLFAAFSDAGSSTGNSLSDTDLVQSCENIEKWDIFEALALEKEVLGTYLSNHPAKLFSKDIANLGITTVGNILSEFEKGANLRSLGHIWLMGIVTSEVKPKKGREGDHFLRGVIESNDASIEFVINGIDNPGQNPHIAKLGSKTPVMFRARIRQSYNREEDTQEKPMLNIDNLERDIMTLSDYIMMKKDENPNLLLRGILELRDNEFSELKEKIQRSFLDPQKPGINIPILAKVGFSDRTKALFEVKGSVNIDNMDKYKEIFGPDNFYLSGALQ